MMALQCRAQVASPPAEQVPDKHVQAIGRAQRVAGLTRFVAKATSLSSGDADKNRAEISCCVREGQNDFYQLQTVLIRAIGNDA